MIAVRVVRDGAVLREQVLRELPIRIGRGPENEVVLLDDSVSRAHATIERDSEGRLVLRDLGSRNGLRHLAVRIPSLTLTGTMRVHVGAVELELQTVSADATQEIRPEDAPERRRSFRHHVGYLLLGTVAWLAYASTRPEIWSPWEKNRSGELLGYTLAALFLQPIVAFLLLVLLRAAGRRVRIGDALRAIARVLWLFPLEALVTTALYYLLPLGPLARVSSLLSSVIAVVTVVYLAGVGRRGPSLGFRLAWTATMALLIVGLDVVADIAARREGQPQTLYQVQVPLLRHTGPAGGVDAYLQGLRQASETAAAKAEQVRHKQE